MKKNEAKVKIKQNITATLRKKPDRYMSRAWNTFLRFLHKFKLISRKFMYNNYIFGETVKKEKISNVICNAGFNAICKRMVADTTYSIEVTHMLLGTGDVTVSASDTTLSNETYRNTTTSGTESDNIVYLTAFFNETEYPASGSVTIKEFGNVMDGTASADTGQLWSHISGLNWEKDTSTSLTVDCKYEFASV